MFFDDSHSNRRELIPHCGFDLHLPDSHFEHFFTCLLTICLIWRIVYSGLLFFLIGCLFLCCWVIWAIYVFWTLTPYHSYHLQIFLLLGRLSFHFVDDFLCCAKTLSLIKFPFVYFCFNFLCLRSKKHIGSDLCQSILCMFSSKSFMVSGLALGL